MDVLTRQELGDDVSTADIDVTSELRTHGAILVVVGELLGHDEAEINAILAHAETTVDTAVDRHGSQTTATSTGGPQHL